MKIESIIITGASFNRETQPDTFSHSLINVNNNIKIILFQLLKSNFHLLFTKSFMFSSQWDHLFL